MIRASEPQPDRLRSAAIDEPRLQSVFGTDDRVVVGDATQFPWRAIGKVTVTADTGIFSGSGFLIGPYHMLTAGHVVHSAAYGGDGWANAITVSFGTVDVLDPFGEAVATEWRAPMAWSTSATAGEDWALVTLDRSLGDALGIFGLGAQPVDDFYDGTQVTIAGYPGDLDNGQQLYASAGPIDSGSVDQLFYNGALDTAGGMSGGPIWQTASGSGERTAIGVHAAGAVDPQAPGAVNAATRLTTARITQIEEWQGQDAILRPPVDRPDLTDGGVFDGADAAALSTVQVLAGGTLSLTISPRNIGTATASGYQITVYASTNATITEFDTVIGTVTGPALAPFETAAAAVPLTIPSSLPTASYYIGWRLDAAEALPEFSEADNSGLADKRLEVTAVPDLVAEEVSFDSLAWVPGQQITADWIIRNAGGAAAPGQPSALYISSDPTVTTSDPRLVRDAFGTVLGPGQTDPEGGTFTYTLGLSPGEYWVAAVADVDGAVVEGSESNNVSAAVRVQIGVAGQVLTGNDDPNGIAGTADNDTIRGLGGNDTLTGREGGDRLEGGNDDDQMFGDAGPDTLLGGFGFDTLFGNAGDDSLVGDLGDGVDGQGDVLNGGSGSDTLIGEGGPDTLSGEDGNDRLDGGPGFDQLNGNAGDDTLIGGALRDSLLGGSGADWIEGEDGNDDIYAGSGNDTVLGGTGPDFVDGEDGDDSLDGGADDDIILGQAGSDTLSGGSGIDRLLGGSGVDLLLGGSGGDRLFAGSGDDSIDGGQGDDLIFGNAGNDSAEGGSGADSLVGEAGADTLSGGPGDDLLAGREEADSLLGGSGSDIVDGEAGDDRLFGGSGDDAVYGRAGADWLAGDAGADFLSGGSEADTLTGGPGDDRLGGDGGTDLFVFAAGDGADLIFDFANGVEQIWIEGGVGSFAALVFGTDGSGRLTVGYSADPGDVITLQGMGAGDLTDDGTILFV
ncbi:MAG: CARDB domain-containing protein [Pseudomonadota bacterium]